mmetsp:Transcript_29892/g.57614  ORF Transcript_29892/g.57614 Transcript_29892/m.57614 type:complete len:137 (-) Transcript_29892:180-590(-)
MNLIVSHLVQSANPPSTEKLQRLDAGLREIFRRAHRNTVFIVTTGQGPSHEIQALNNEKFAAQREGLKPGGRRWTLDKEVALSKAIAKSKEGMVFFTIKQLDEGKCVSDAAMNNSNESAANNDTGMPERIERKTFL